VTQTADTAKETKPELVTATIDGREVSVPKGTLIIRAAEQAGIQIPRFCDHPLLAPAGACRQCLVDVAMPDREGNVRPMPKPQASCTMEVTPGMQVATQHTSEVADKAQHGIMEFLLVNHPLDCPVCDKGGECPLQNQAMSNGRAESRFVDVKRTFPKPIAVSTQILLDRDRCILCQRCTRFSSQIAGDAFIALQGRGAGSPGREVHALNGSQIGTFDADVLGFSHESEVHDSAIPYAGPDGAPGTTVGHATAPVGAAEMDTSGRPFSSYFSGNTIQICPVGALTSAMYRFRSRPFDLVSTPSVAEHDASGSAIRVDNRRGKVVRRLAGNDPEVNEEWITDKDRFAFHWQDAPDRLRMPLVRDQATGVMHETSWSHALSVAGEELARAAADGGVGLLPGGHLTLEDSYAWSKFARTVLGTNDIDFRARPGSDEESAFLAAGVASTGLGVTYSDVETAGRVLLVALEPEEECGTLFLRLRKGVLARTTAVTTLAPFAIRGTTKLSADLVEVVPGGEAAALDALDAGLVEQLSGPGAVILLGERAAVLPGTLSAAVRLAERTGARLQWVPRRAGERGALEAGALPGLLPGARPVTDPTARADAGAIWHVDSLPSAPGRDHRAILAAAGTRELTGVVVGGIDLSDLPDPNEALRQLGAADVVVQLEVRRNAISELADVVLPVAPPVEKAGSFVNWEGRVRPFGQVLTSHALPDRVVLRDLAAEMGHDLGLSTLAELHAELAEFDPWSARTPAPSEAPGTAATAPAGSAVLATWRLQLDSGRGQDGEPHLAGTAHKPVLRLSAATAASIGAADGTRVRLTGPTGSLGLPLVVTAMPDGVVWVPEHSAGSAVRGQTGAGVGSVVTLTAVEVAK
jgi:NADH-quinone oxidoreductase subunit G